MYSVSAFIISSAFMPASEFTAGVESSFTKDPPKPRNMLLKSWARFQPDFIVMPKG